MKEKTTNEIIKLTQEKIEKIKAQFSSIKKTGEKTVQIHDWLDDSVQTITIK